MHFDLFCGTSFAGKDMQPKSIGPVIRKEYIIHYIIPLFIIEINSVKATIYFMFVGLQ